MGTPQWSLHIAALAAALASAIAFAGMMPAAAAPAIVPDPPTARPDVVRVQNSTIVRRESSHRDGGTWKKRRHHRDSREHSREHARDHEDGDRKFRPRATPKYAYDAYGHYRTYDGDGWDRDQWDGWDKKKRNHRPWIYKRQSFDFQGPSPALKNVLTAVPH